MFSDALWGAACDKAESALRTFVKEAREAGADDDDIQQHIKDVQEGVTGDIWEDE